MAWIGNVVFKNAPQHNLLLRKLLILATSFFLLGMACWQTVVIFFVLSLLSFYGCKWGLTMEMRKRKVLLWFLLPIALIPLLYYKYANFFGNEVFHQNWDSFRNLIIPIGISFYSFQMVAFCVDTLMQDLKMPKLIDYLNFGAFFPQVVAGPIERRALLLPQLETLNSNSRLIDDINLGVRYIIAGIFYKLVLSDNIGTGIPKMMEFDSAYQIYLLNLFFTFRIYFDFAGYSLIAFGLARCLGIEITLNFKSPLTAVNIGEYWRRWHSSLSTWLRDYIYFPLGGSRTKWWALNIMIVFFVSGLWHGANWNFVIWGLSLGIGLIIFRCFHRAGYRLWWPIAFAITSFYTVNVRMFFYITNIDTIKANLQTLCTPEAYAFTDFSNFSILYGLLMPILTASFIIPVIVVYLCLEALAIRKEKTPYYYVIAPTSTVIQIFFICFFTPGLANQFVYLAF